jgi:ADP-heptose:LPS heptosyltransferase
VPDPAAPELLGGARSIAVVRANGLGDLVVAEPALAALRAAAPAAHIVLIGTPLHAALLEGRPSPVDEVVIAPPVVGVRQPGPDAPEDPAATAAFLARMRARAFDVAFQLHGGGRFSNPFTSALGAATTIGMRDRDAPPLDRTIRYEYWQPEVARYLEVVGLAGAQPVRLQPQLVVTDGDRSAAAEALWEVGLHPGRPWAVLHPGATDPRRRWPAQRFGAVAAALLADGAQVVVIGTPDEADVAADVVGHAPGAADLAGRLGLPALVGLLAGAALLVGNDSGPRHVADALGTPTVSVYWCGNALNAGPITRDRHRVHIGWTLACPVCGHPAVGGEVPGPCSHAASYVADVATRDVCHSARSVYAGRVAGRGG